VRRRAAPLVAKDSPRTTAGELQKIASKETYFIRPIKKKHF